MMWDLLGSMSPYSRRIAVQNSFQNFVEILKPANASGNHVVRIGFAPYSDSVNVGPYKGLITTQASPNNCVAERGAPDVYTDAGPTISNPFEVLVDVEQGSSGIFRWPCPEIEILRLTDDRNLILDQFDDLDDIC